MGAPVVRRDELEAELKKQNAKINRVKREVRAEITEYLEERFARLEAVLELVPEGEVGELELEPDNSAGKDPLEEALEDPEGHELVAAIHERKESPGQTPDILSGLEQEQEGSE